MLNNVVTIKNHDMGLLVLAKKKSIADYINKELGEALHEEVENIIEHKSKVNSMVHSYAVARSKTLVGKLPKAHFSFVKIISIPNTKQRMYCALGDSNELVVCRDGACKTLESGSQSQQIGAYDIEPGDRIGLITSSLVQTGFKHKLQKMLSEKVHPSVVEEWVIKAAKRDFVSRPQEVGILVYDVPYLKNESAENRVYVNAQDVVRWKQELVLLDARLHELFREKKKAKN
ncbi:MAG: hypothetical protein ABIH21_04075, partial [Patescibacteria group bacterium]